MNFSEFSFWWTFGLLSTIIFGLRGLLRWRGWWRPAWDAVALAVLSMALFINAARTSAVIFGFEVLFTFVMVQWMNRLRGWGAVAVGISAAAVDLGILVYFKYLNFLVGNLMGATPMQTSDWAQAMAVAGMIGIPPGISFYTFQKIAYIVDSHREEHREPLKLLDFVNFAAFFPQIVAGPIERRKDLLPQMQNFTFRFDVDDLEHGLRWVVLGLFMKLVLADNLAPNIDYAEALNPWAVWASVCMFGARIYFDFAGYSLIALGLARIMGIRLTMNFLSPYGSMNIQEFWRRWHVTLSGWFRDYLYKPLGGSRVTWWAANIMAVFVVSGLWHGAGWNFILWGAFHGLLLLLYQFVGRRIPMPRFLAWMLTLGSVMCSWLFFMETNLHRLWTKLGTMATPTGYTVTALSDAIAKIPNNAWAALGLITVFIALEIACLWRDPERPYRWFTTPAMSKVMLVGLVILAARTSNPFIYFAF